MGWLCVQEAPSPPARVCESHQPEPRLCPLPSPPPPSPQALGCILYLLCFGQHPFEDGARLRILNGKYSIPADDTRYLVFHSLIRESRVWGLLGMPLPRPAWLLGSFPSVGFPTEHLLSASGSHSAPGGGWFYFIWWSPFKALPPLL